ncbi:MAG: type II toxin-antitoxin system VapB family antitoxin, partial [Candidatus Dormibacteraeota bacterium]|nr:type II toxin-antitoxin system VapB family antitoxin [Candidatus Dormibacteraeota bacterium]
MGRTNIELDDRLVTEAMSRYGLRSKREAVDFALRRLLGEPLSAGAALALEGTDWEG